MIGILARMVFGKILSDDLIKKQIFNELRLAAAKSDTKIDDEAVDALEVAWKIAVPIIIGR